MSAIRIVSVALLLPLASGGCSGSPTPKPVKTDPRPEVYEPVYRVATELRSAQEVGMNRRRFGELLEKLATEISLAKDKAESAKEQRVIQGYAEVLQVYKDAAAIWDVKISVPELKDLSEQHSKNLVAAGSIDGIQQNYKFATAVSEGIPLNFPGGGNTGIDSLVTQYQLPVKDSEGWKTIPNDSVERVWSRARAKTEEIVKLQKS
jgi:hypothetical protein